MLLLMNLIFYSKIEVVELLCWFVVVVVVVDDDGCSRISWLFHLLLPQQESILEQVEWKFVDGVALLKVMAFPELFVPRKS